MVTQATATMNTALEFLTRNFNAGIVIDFENPSPDDPRPEISSSARRSFAECFCKAAWSVFSVLKHDAEDEAMVTQLHQELMCWVLNF